MVLIPFAVRGHIGENFTQVVVVVGLEIVHDLVARDTGGASGAAP